MELTLQNIRKEFRGATALKDVSLNIRAGELIALLGPSGSGKTTLLRLIAGLEFPTRGTILFGGEDASRKSVQDRHVGFVFQHYALFKHMTVFENIAFGLKIRPRAERPSHAAITQKVHELLELIQLEGLEKRYPSQLSGGQRQRIALARALAIDPTVLLLDEPFGALDAQVRKDLRRWLRELHSRTHHTTVFVTHDQEEALELADRVVVMSEGQIEQVGTPDEVYDKPATAFVYGFLGSANVLPAHVKDRQVLLQGFETSLAATDTGLEGPVDLYVRPHDFDLTDDRLHAVPGIVQMVRHFSGVTRMEVRVPNHTEVITVEIHDGRLLGKAALEVGGRVLLRPRRFGLYPRQSSVDSAVIAAREAAPRLKVVS